MTENGDVVYSVTYGTILTLFFLLVVLLILLFFLYKYLNKEAKGKYTVQRIVFREGGLRDRARARAVALGNRLGVQLWPGSDLEQDEERGEDEDEEEEEAHSNRNESCDEDDVVQVNEQRSDSVAEGDAAKESSGDDSGDSADEEEQAEAKPEQEPQAEAVTTEEEPKGDDVQEDKADESSAPIVINLNQFSGSVLWSDEEKCEGGDVTAL